MRPYLKIAGIIILLFTQQSFLYGQTCTERGQTPATAFPVCGTKVFHQASVPLCVAGSIYVPGCPEYPAKNPYFYKFTCYTGGTLSFLIAPISPNEDYDWQLFDVTGQDPEAILWSKTLGVSGNWSADYGVTGTSSQAVGSMKCGGPGPTLNQEPVLIKGHNYILLISHFTPGQSGYSLSFIGGTADITDRNIPHMVKAEPVDCSGKKIKVSFNKSLECGSYTINGSEFLTDGTVTGAEAATCKNGFDFDNLILTLATPLTPGTHQLLIKEGSDGNTLADLCGLEVPTNETIEFEYNPPAPRAADSVSNKPCAPDSILLYYPLPIDCASISASGSDFEITGPSPVTILGASANCQYGGTSYIIIKFTKQITTKGTYVLRIKSKAEGNTMLDLCGQPPLPQSFPFQTKEGVSALFTTVTKLGCRQDTLSFRHDGAHDATIWQWTFNNVKISAPSHTLVWPASSTNTVHLFVSNGTCTDTLTTTIKLDNEVKADFLLPSVTCPEDKVELLNNTVGDIARWQWTFDKLGASTAKDPPPFLFPATGKEMFYSVTLAIQSDVFKCRDSIKKTIQVLDHCFIAVPTAFTPNHDGVNDTFGPHNALKADNFSFQVFNRMGQMVFQSRRWTEKWNGTINGALQPSGVYVWMLRYTNRDTQKIIFQKGTVALIR